MGKSMAVATGKIRGISPHSRAHSLAKLDGRTREARLMQKTREELFAHVGGEPTATQRALIERAVALTIRCAIMDERFAASGVQTDNDSRTYLGWSNALNRTMRELGVQAAPRRAMTLSDHLAAKAATA